MSHARKAVMRLPTWRSAEGLGAKRPMGIDPSLTKMLGLAEKRNGADRKSEMGLMEKAKRALGGRGPVSSHSRPVGGRGRGANISATFRCADALDGRGGDYPSANCHVRANLTTVISPAP